MSLLEIWPLFKAAQITLLDSPALLYLFVSDIQLHVIDIFLVFNRVV